MRQSTIYLYCIETRILGSGATRRLNILIEDSRNETGEIACNFDNSSASKAYTDQCVFLFNTHGKVNN